MARVFFGRVLAIVVFVFAVLIVGAWVTRDRPTAWLAHLAGDDPGLGTSQVPATPAASPVPSVPTAERGLTAAASAHAARLGRRPAAR